MLLLGASLSAQTLPQTPEGELPSASSLPDQSTARSFYIEDVIYSIKGRTQTYALAKLLNIQIGKVFDTFQDLRLYTIEKERILKDNRVFTESSHIEIELPETAPPELPPTPQSSTPSTAPLPVYLHVYVEDTWTALAVPFLKFSDADGLSFALRYKDFNFLGTLNPITTSADYYLITKTFDAGTQFEIYPTAFANTWDTALSANLRYSPTTGIHLYDLTAAISSDIKPQTRGQTPYLEFSPTFSYQYHDIYKEHLATIAQKVNYTFGRGLNWNTGLNTAYAFDSIAAVPHQWQNTAYLNVSFPLLRLPAQAIVNLNLNSNAFYTINIAAFSPYDAGLGSTISLGYSAVDWLGNFRRGSTFNLSETLAWYLLQPSPSRPYDLLIDASASFFTSFKNLVGLEGRILGRWNASWTLQGDTTYRTQIEWGSYLRGIKTTLYGDLAAIANLQFPINFAQGRFFGWSKLEAEVFLIPFFDAGYVRPSPDQALWDPSHLYLTGGADLVVFPVYARSFTYRLSVGYNLLNLIRTGAVRLNNFEVWLGIGLHF
jgi:hypothetical protein